VLTYLSSCVLDDGLSWEDALTADFADAEPVADAPDPLRRAVQDRGCFIRVDEFFL
jgi:hypothetical protein